jgi:ABC-type uncharacterized transport system involved in gliding motility auxiliary subunit
MTDKISDTFAPRPRRFVIGINTLMAILVAAVIVGMLNFLAFRHYKRFDWTRTKQYALSEKTVEVLRALTQPIRVIVFFQPGHELYEEIRNLLSEYQYQSRQLSVEFVDPDRNLGRAKELAEKYEITTINAVVFDAGERSRHVTLTDLADYDWSELRFGGTARAKNFKGEQAFTSAIVSIVHAEQPTVYFLTGHGERDPENNDPRRGYSTLARVIRQDNIAIETLNLPQAQKIPDDCAALVIAAPQRAFAREELDLIRGWLRNGGRLIVLLDRFARTGIESLLAEWNVEVGNDVVLDPLSTLTGQEIFVSDYGRHPITEKLQGTSSIFYLPRSVSPRSEAGRPIAAADAPEVVPLAQTSMRGWAETDVEQQPYRFDPDRDKRGPISVAVAAEKGAVAGVDIPPTRLVVFGDGDFVSNAAIGVGANADLFLNAVNWMLKREPLLAIGPKPVERIQVNLSAQQLRTLLLTLVAGMPLLIAVVGGLVWLRRRT